MTDCRTFAKYMTPTQDKELERQLKQHGLRNTAFRKEILSIFLKHKGKAIGHADIEDSLGEWDRITLYRTIKSFEDKGLIHPTPDVNGSIRYALCGHRCSAHDHNDSHAHFHCTVCNETRCLDDVVENFSFRLPMNYTVHETKVLLEGTCSACN